ncbi:acyl-CoA thioesterase [Balneola sp. MJW-20]|uniref:acyl-CoA thioesterase n=1 Tax=Gracilimonas aurantiaca TaxID=3234185 RepID=UPI0034661002
MFRPGYDPEIFYHWCEIPVRFRDLDPLNHVNNALFNTYLEEARLQFLNELGVLKEAFEEGKSFVLVKCTVEYLKQITFPSTLLIGTGIGEIGNSSIQAVQGIFNKDSKELLSVGYSKGVWFDLNTQRPTRLPEFKDLDKLMVDMN